MKLTNKQLATVFIDSVQDVTEHELNESSKVFVEFLRSRGELKRLKEIVRAIDQIWIERHGMATLTIQSAYPLTAALRNSVIKLAAGAEVREVVDPTLIGGARLRIDERIIDGSLKGALEQLTVTLSK
jgi:F-type H+-transporting ATPase subunit delta